MESPVLIDIGKDGSLKETTINTEKFLIGRGLQNGLVVENVNVSRTHCIIERSNNQWNILDKSSNGTFLNGKILDKDKKYKLTPGDIISLHEHLKYVFKIPSGSSKVKLNGSLDHSYNKPSSEVTVTVNNNNANPLSEEEILNIADSVIEAFEAQHDSDSILTNIIESRGISETSSSTINVQPNVVTNEINEQVPQLTVERYEEVVTSDNTESGKTASSLNIPGHHQSSQELKPTTSNSEKTNNLEYAEDELQCSICTEMFIEAVTLSCSHTFCKYCITQWQKHQSVCPICRTKTTLQFTTRVLDNFIEKMLENADDEIKERRRQLIEQRQASSSTSTSTLIPKEIPSTSAVNTASTSTINTRSRRRAAANPIEISSEEGSDEEELSDFSGSNWGEEYDYDEWEDYNGIRGRYYGGYGHCYACGQTGHWANGCPNKRRR